VYDSELRIVEQNSTGSTAGVSRTEPSCRGYSIGGHCSFGVETLVAARVGMHSASGTFFVRFMGKYVGVESESYKIAQLVQDFALVVLMCAPPYALSAAVPSAGDSFSLSLSSVCCAEDYKADERTANSVKLRRFEFGR